MSEGLINWEYFKSDSFWTYPHEAEERCGLHWTSRYFLTLLWVHDQHKFLSFFY